MRGDKDSLAINFKNKLGHEDHEFVFKAAYGSGGSTIKWYLIMSSTDGM
jgi:hypothetical protein